MNTADTTRPLGSIEPALAAQMAKVQAERAGGWLGDAEAFADPEQHGRAFRAAWRHLLRLTRSLDRLTTRLDRENPRNWSQTRGKQDWTLPEIRPGSRSATGEAKRGAP